jgi:dihydrofolate reductase
MIQEIEKLKRGNKDMTILGSGSIVTQCAEHGLIDTYQIMIDPVAIGEGKPMFSGMKHKLELELTDSRIFKSGVVLLTYRQR